MRIDRFNLWCGLVLMGAVLIGDGSPAWLAYLLFAWGAAVVAASINSDPKGKR